jgi:hypothetical protein
MLLLLLWLILRGLSKSGRELWVGRRVRRWRYSLRRIKPKPRRRNVGVLGHWCTILFEIRRSRSWAPRGLHQIHVGGTKIRMPRREALLVTHHGVEVRVVEIGASRRGVSRGAQTVYLRSGEIRRPRRQCRASEGPSTRVRLSQSRGASRPGLSPRQSPENRWARWGSGLGWGYWERRYGDGHGAGWAADGSSLAGATPLPSHPRFPPPPPFLNKFLKKIKIFNFFNIFPLKKMVK